MLKFVIDSWSESGSAVVKRALAGYDVKFSGQVPYLPWAKVKATRYIWDGVAQPNVKGTIFGIEVQLSDSVRMEFGSEDNNTVERKTYARFTTALFGILTQHCRVCA
jgi:hypothetical protein